MGRPRKYTDELRRRAIEEVLERDRRIPEVAKQLGIASPESLRRWVRQAEFDRGSKVGPTSEELAEVKALRREVADHQRTIEILEAATTCFAQEADPRPRSTGRDAPAASSRPRSSRDRLVQRGPPPRRDRRHPTRRTRSRLISSQPANGRSRHHLIRTARDPVWLSDCSRATRAQREDRVGAYACRCTRTGEKAGRQIETYRAGPSGVK
jgi:transposase